VPTSEVRLEPRVASKTVPRQPRSLLPDGIFHVTARAVADDALFVDDHDRKRFLWLLSQLCNQCGIRRRAHCLMGTHYRRVASR